MTQKFKIKPDDIKICKDNPFEHDLLDREQPIRILTNILINTENPYTISIDASWGNGKTTFLNMWKQHLRNEKFPVIEFNAWETDFAGDPLVAITSELLESTKANNNQQVDESDKPSPSEKLRMATSNLLNHITPTRVAAALSLLNLVVSAQPDDQLASTIVGSASTSAAAADAFSNDAEEEYPDAPPDPVTYDDTKKAICSFRTALRDVANSLSCRHQNKPLIIAIDELDRCRPSYAVELLEIVKHFFAVDNIVFVLAIDKSQLSHAIQAIYGSNFDSVGYLRRFIDLDFRLPSPDRKTFMKQLMKQTGLLRFFESPYNYWWGYSGDAQRLLGATLSSPTVSIRKIQQALYHLGLALASLDSSENIPYAATAVLVILKTLDPATYRRFLQSNMTDKEVLDKLLGLPEFQSIKSMRDGALFEALLAIGYCEFVTRQGRDPMLETQSLFHHYFGIIDSLPNFPADDAAFEELSTPPTPHERMVMGHLATYYSMVGAVRRHEPVGFDLTAQRLELFSSDLIGDNS